MAKHLMRFLLLLALSLFPAAIVQGGTEIVMYSNPVEAPFLVETIKDWEAKTGNKVTLLTGSAGSSDNLALYQQQLGAGTSDVDIYELDVVWPGLLANHLVDLKEYSNGREKLHTQPVITNNTINGRLVSMPLYLDAGMMFYRKDLLDKYSVPVPGSWDELIAAAKKITTAEHQAGNNKLWGLVFQGRAYEGLTCAALEWIDSYGGGTIIDIDGNVTINNPQAAAALTAAAAWIGDISPSGVLNYAEEDARGVFQSGDSVFMRNWPYAWALGQADDSPVKGKIGIMPVPKGTGSTSKPSGALGGWGIGISKYSKKIAVAADLVFFLSSAEGQRRFSLLGSYTPSALSLFDDPEIKAKNPVAILDVFNNAVPRPAGVTGSKYNRV
ncbi:MAG: ABC transporter substrate-binding protein, partial [Planctomycetota bacterium]|nr:ABC transporter substrate-binding protein [Planctomycetota bacterium]